MLKLLFFQASLLKQIQAFKTVTALNLSSDLDPNQHHLSNGKRAPGWLGYIGDETGDEILPIYIGIIIEA